MRQEPTGEWVYVKDEVHAVLRALESLWVVAGGKRPEVAAWMLNGRCPTGLDAIALKWAEGNGIHVRVYPADWSAGRSAGPLRNQKMIDDAEVLLAFPGGKGTADTIRRAETKGIGVIHAIL